MALQMPARPPIPGAAGFFSRITLTSVVLVLSFSTIIGIMLAIAAVFLTVGRQRRLGAHRRAAGHHLDGLGRPDGFRAKAADYPASHRALRDALQVKAAVPDALGQRAPDGAASGARHHGPDEWKGDVLYLVQHLADLL
jgi:hypothetical protein